MTGFTISEFFEIPYIPTLSVQILINVQQGIIDVRILMTKLPESFKHVQTQTTSAQENDIPVIVQKATMTVPMDGRIRPVTV